MDDDLPQVPPPIKPEEKEETDPAPDQGKTSPSDLQGFFKKAGVMFSPLPQVSATGEGTMAEQDEKLWAMLSHILAIIGLGFIGPLVIYFVQKDQSPFVASHARESLNFQLTMMIILVVCMMLMFLVIPFFIFMAAMVLMMVAGVMAGIKAYEGDFMALPFTIRMIK